MDRVPIRSGQFGRRLAAWRAADPIPGVDPAFARLDPFGTEIHWHQYGCRGAAYGWELDHCAFAENGAARLRALHWCNSVAAHRPAPAAAPA